MKKTISRVMGAVFALLLTNACFSQVSPRKVASGVRQLEVRLPDKVSIDSSAIQLVFPGPYCPTKTANPTFRWKSLKQKSPKTVVSYEFTLVEMNPSDTTMQDFEKKKVIFAVKGIRNDSLAFPENIGRLEMRKLYGWQVRQYENDRLAYASVPLPFYIIGYKLPFDSDEITCCPNNLVANGTFEKGAANGTLGREGRARDWEAGYGNPAMVSRDDGCRNPGYIRLSGNMKTGDCITQALQATRIQQGRHYRFSACIRLSNARKDAGYAYIKVIAFNGSLPASALHPVASASVSNMGWSGKLMSKDWVTFSLDVWTANKNFDSIGIYCLTADDRAVVCDIDNICLIETADARSCDDYAYDDLGAPIIDSSLTAQIQNQVYTDYEQDNGNLIHLYGSQGYDGTTSFYQLNDGCSSIGGQIPAAVTDFNLDDSLSELGFEGGTEELEKILKMEFKDASKRTRLRPIKPLTDPSCKESYQPDTTVPFSGRDIIFVHGLKLEHLCERSAKNPAAMKDWPDDKAEFYSGGYYKKLAEDGWADHIQEWLRGRGYRNRVLVVAYNCSQRADVAAHAILTQIRDAMQGDAPGEVKFVEGDKRKGSCFGRDAVIVSHSTGALVTDIALSIAKKSKNDPVLQRRFGNVGFIADNMKLHVAFQGAFMGSKMATVFLASQTVPGLNKFFAELTGCSGYNVDDRLISRSAMGSILIDLQPSVAASLWLPVISTSPVPSITIAGSHSYGTFELKPLVNVGLHPGFDDGVLTMGSQSANPWFEVGANPVGFNRQPGLYKLYDMGLGSGISERANRYFLNQTLFCSPPFVAGAGTPFLSPTGMVEPVAQVPALSNPENRLPNHFSFLQSASDHYTGPRGRKPSEGYNIYNHAGTSGFRSLGYDYFYESGRHWEESLVITNPAVFARGYINPSVINSPEEKVRGRYLDFDVYGPQFSIKCCWKFKMWWGPMFHVRVTVWERKYHLMGGSDTECEAGYVYRYVLR